jgi:hypothetical protein
MRDGPVGDAVDAGAELAEQTMASGEHGEPRWRGRACGTAKRWVNG